MGNGGTGGTVKGGLAAANQSTPTALLTPRALRTAAQVLNGRGHPGPRGSLPKPASADRRQGPLRSSTFAAGPPPCGPDRTRGRSSRSPCGPAVDADLLTCSSTDAARPPEAVLAIGPNPPAYGSLTTRSRRTHRSQGLRNSGAATTAEGSLQHVSSTAEPPPAARPSGLVVLTRGTSTSWGSF